MKHVLRLTVLLLFLHDPQARALAATELARINGTSISLEDFNKRFDENRRLLQLRTPSKKALLDEIVKRELAVQEARKLRLDQDPEVLERINTVLYYALLERQLGKEIEKIVVSDADAKTYYQKNPEIRTAHIFVPLAANAPAEDAKIAAARVKKIYEEHVASGKMTFAEAAQRFSEGPAAAMGGDIDYQTRDRLDPAYYEAAIRLSPGKVAGPIRTQFGYHMIRLTAVRSWEDADRAQVKRQVFESKRANLFDQYIGRLRASAKVSVRSNLIQE
jgi:peptidyl-prolyl cis-trans isomerase C